MPFPFRAAAEPSPAVRARLASLFGVAPPPDPEQPAPPAPPGAEPLDNGRRTALALVAVAVAAVAVTGAVVWRGRPTPVPLPPVAVTTSSPAPALLVVDVAGDVRRPGLVRLPSGSRVADAIAAAGGLRRGATTTGLNLARKLVDGEQVLVGAATAPPAPGTTAANPLLNLNTATADQLDELPGIGPVLADRIVEWRTAHGAFTTVDQLREVSGIGARKFESLRELVTV